MGTVHHSKTLAPLYTSYVPYAAPEIRWTIAANDVASLQEVTPVQPTELALTQ